MLDYYSTQLLQHFVTDCGDWHLEITAATGRSEYHGPLIPSPCPFLNQVSDLIRETLGREDILAFDGMVRKENLYEE